jgi:outer membrane receptor protein involved in Fe transport
MKEFVLCSRHSLAVLGLVCVSVCLAQTPTAQITGRITDPSGAVIPGVSVTVINVATAVERPVESNEVGYYTAPLLPPGDYRIVVEKEGFRLITRTGINLVVQQVARIDFTMEVGAVTETVEVIGEAPLLESETSSIGQVVDSRNVSELPLRGRNPYALVALIPGARVPISWRNLPMDMFTSQYALINGARGNQNEFILDGIANTNTVSSGPNIFPTPDSIQEFNVVTNNFSAEYGRAAGGVFNVVTKSGTNQLHGSLWEFHRNENINANAFFANRFGRPKPAFTFNQYGGTVGGPIQRDKTFIFGSYEKALQREGQIYVGQVPTALERMGDFSEIRNSRGQPITIFDPLTGTGDPGNPIREPFPNNMLPPDRINQAMRTLQDDFLPLPNTAGAEFTNADNFASAAPIESNKTTFMVKADHIKSQKQRISGSFHFDRSPWLRPNAYGNIASPVWGPQIFQRRAVVFDDTYTINPTTVFNFRYGMSRLTNERAPHSFGIDISQFGFEKSYADASQVASIPVIRVQGFTGAFSTPNLANNALLGASDVIFFGLDNHSWNANLTRIQGKHSLKAGFEFRLVRSNTWQVTEKDFRFNRGFTQGPDPTRASGTAGYGYASVLLGTAATGRTAFSPAIAAQFQYYAGYIQDSFHVSPNLTLNLGLRWEFTAGRTDRYEQLANFDYGGAVPLDAPDLSLRGVLQFPATGGLPRTQTDGDFNNFAPRFGFSYRLTPRTVIRGGGGVSYAPFQSGSGAGGLSGFSATTAFVASLDGITPINFIDNPHPNGLVFPTGSSLGAATLLGQGVRFVNRNGVTPYAIQWNLDIQRELPGQVLFDVAYVGNSGVKISSSRTLNQLPDASLSLGNELRKQVPNPFFGQITKGALSRRTIPLAQLLRPFPHFTGVTATQSPWGNSIYHALQAKVTKRAGNGLTFLASYAFSKLIDDVGSSFAGERTGQAGRQNWNNLRGERAVSGHDQVHSLVFSYVWELPFGPGKSLGSTAAGALAKLIGGWQLQGVASLQSGGPIGVTTSPNTTFSQGGGQRPDWTGQDANLGSSRSIDRWFDTSQFSRPPPFTFGNIARTMGGLRAHGTKNWDFTLAKYTQIAEGHRIQLRVEMFNALNTPRFNPPGRNLATPTFGRVSVQANQSRVIQLGLKYIF